MRWDFGRCDKDKIPKTFVRKTHTHESPASDPSLRIIYYRIAYASFLSHFFAQYETEGEQREEEEEDTNNR